MKNSALNENGFGFACFAYLYFLKKLPTGGGKPLDCCLCSTLFVPRNFGEEPENTMREAFWKLTSNTFNVNWSHQTLVQTKGGCVAFLTLRTTSVSS